MLNICVYISISIKYSAILICCNVLYAPYIPLEVCKFSDNYHTLLSVCTKEIS